VTRGQEAEEKDEPVRLQDYEVVVEDSISYFPSLHTVAARFPAPIHSTPASVEVVTAPLFESQNATVLSEALNYIGVVVIVTPSRSETPDRVETGLGPGAGGFQFYPKRCLAF
jgi:outer membrane receptor for monomeric catechols